METKTPRFAVSTTYDERAYSVLVHVMMQKRRLPRYVIIGTGFASMIYAGYIILTTRQIGFVPFLFLLLGNITALLGILLPRLATRMMVASGGKKETPCFHYAFFDHAMHITSALQTHDYSYSYISRVLDSQGFLLFFFRDGQVFLLDHAQMGDAESANLRAFINERLSQYKKP